MPSSPEPGARRLLGLKQAQMRLARAAALVQRQQALDCRDQADALRSQAEQMVDRAVPLPEAGLSRTTLYDRLRTLAVARAHALELQHRAGELEAQAQACDTQRTALQEQALAHQRKHSKLDCWHQRERQMHTQQRLRRQHHHLLEDISCRPPQPR